jgi:hypothetical protein
MQKEQLSKSAELCAYLAKREQLAEKKAKIYSRLLTEVGLAKEMETLALRHSERVKKLQGGEEK